MNDDRLREVFGLLEHRIETRWNIPVRIQDVPDPFTGDLDGEQIMVDHDLDIENAVFILVHLFGHTVQWNVSESGRAVAFAKPDIWTEDMLAAVSHYEHEAASYSLQLLHDVGVFDLDQWMSDFAACDAAYLQHFYRTGDKLPFKSFWQGGALLLAPRAIPDFAPTRWMSRAGTVV